MDFISVKEYAETHNISERTVRNYCALGKIAGAQLVGKTWNIPKYSPLPSRIKTRTEPSQLLKTLKEQKDSQLKGGIYHRTQIELTYNSNHIEGSRLSKEQTRYIFETNTIGIAHEVIRVDDIIETTNHFRCIDFIIEHARTPLTEGLIKELHLMLKSGTSDASKDWFAVGAYKKLPNEVGGTATTAPKKVASAVRTLLKDYHAKGQINFEDILDFVFATLTIPCLECPDSFYPLTSIFLMINLF